MKIIYKSLLGICGIWHVYYVYWFFTIHNTIKKGLIFGIPKEDA
jgi:hypothetical protein